MKVTIDKNTGNFSISTNGGVVQNKLVFGYQCIPVQDPIIVEDFVDGLKFWSICPGASPKKKNAEDTVRAPACPLLVSSDEPDAKMCRACERYVERILEKQTQLCSHLNYPFQIFTLSSYLANT